MPIGDDTYAYRRRLPHLEKTGKTYFITFTSCDRWILPHVARDIALQCVVHDHLKTYFLHCAVVMPDHVHLIISPFATARLSSIMSRIKSVSARLINEALKERGHVWDHESFDHILRSDEQIRAKSEYVCANPVRAGLVESPDDYPWLWRSWHEGAAEVGGATP